MTVGHCTISLGFCLEELPFELFILVPEAGVGHFVCIVVVAKSWPRLRLCVCSLCCFSYVVFVVYVVYVGVVVLVVVVVVWSFNVRLLRERNETKRSRRYDDVVLPEAAAAVLLLRAESSSGSGTGRGSTRQQQQRRRRNKFKRGLCAQCELSVCERPNTERQIPLLWPQSCELAGRALVGGGATALDSARTLR